MGEAAVVHRATGAFAPVRADENLVPTSPRLPDVFCIASQRGKINNVCVCYVRDSKTTSKTFFPSQIPFSLYYLLLLEVQTRTSFYIELVILKKAASHSGRAQAEGIV